MSETAEKDAAGVKLFPPGVPLVAILGGVLLDWLIPLDPGFTISPIFRYALGGAILVVAIGLIGFPAVRIMRSTGQSENPYKPTTEIVEQGPFRYTRNPMYLQMVIACIGFAVLLWNGWILILTPLCWAALHFFVILPEERYLERKFGTEYLAYKERVRRWI